MGVHRSRLNDEAGGHGGGNSWYLNNKAIPSLPRANRGNTQGGIIMADEKASTNAGAKNASTRPSQEWGLDEETKPSCSGPSGPYCSWVNLILSST